MREFTVALLFALALVPGVTAQAPNAQLSIDPPHQTLVLDADGRGQAHFNVTLRATGFVCVRDAGARAMLGFSPFPKWAGASVEPPEARWTIPAPGPGAGTIEEDSTHLTNHAWDLSLVPREVTATYTVEVKGFRMTSGECAPEPRVEDYPQVRVTVCLPPTAGGPSGRNCTTPEAESELIVDTEPAYASFPGISAALVTVIAVMGVARRRYHKK